MAMDLDQLFGWAGFFVSLGVLATPALTAFKLLRAGTVGNMTITFFLFVFMNCVNMTTYGILTNNIQLMLCNIYGICSATFAIRTFLSLLKEKEMSHRQQKAVAAMMGTTMDGATGTIRGEGEGSGGHQSSINNRAASPDAIAIKVDSNSQTASNVAQITEAAAAAATESFNRVYKQTTIFCGADLAVILLVIILTFLEFPSAAKSICGFAATLMGTVMFSGPLDQIGWILKNKSSAPLEPMIMLAAAANSICWGAYGLITLDPWLIFPNTCGLVLAVIQALLLMWFPRNSAAATVADRNIGSMSDLHDGRAPPTEAQMQHAITNAREDHTRPKFIDT